MHQDHEKGAREFGLQKHRMRKSVLEWISRGDRGKSTEEDGLYC